MKVNIKGLNKAKVLASLYNSAAPQGMGFFQADNRIMTEEVAADILKEYTHFDYLRGRPLKLSLDKDDEVDVALYDRDNGEGVGKFTIDELRRTGEVSTKKTQLIQKGNLAEKAMQAEDFSHSKSTSDAGSFTLGADDNGPALREAIKRVVGKS